MALPLIAAAASLASSLYGGVKSAAAGRRAKREAERERAREDAWYARAYNERYADTAAGQDLLRRGKELSDANWNKVRGQQSVTNSTDAAAALAKEQGVRQQGDMLARVASNDTSRRDRADLSHRRQSDVISERERGIEMQTSQNIANAAQQASNNLMSAAVALEGMRAESPGVTSTVKSNPNEKYLSDGVKAANAGNVGKSANGTPKSVESAMPKPEDFGTDAERRSNRVWGKPEVGSPEWEKERLEEEEKRARKPFNPFDVT